MGLVHGVYCVACCWFLMGLLFLGGVMNLFRIAGLAFLVLLEKTFPGRRWFSHLLGGGLVFAAALMLVL
jgi:predicted metal-binding membrane protein